MSRSSVVSLRRAAPRRVRFLVQNFGAFTAISMDPQIRRGQDARYFSKAVLEGIFGWIFLYFSSGWDVFSFLDGTYFSL